MFEEIFEQRILGKIYKDNKCKMDKESFMKNLFDGSLFSFIQARNHKNRH